MESILTSIKNKMMITEEDISFDAMIIVAINNALFKLKTLGVGPEKGFSITDNTQTWDDYITGSDTIINGIKTFIFISTKLEVDPPQSSAVSQCYERQLNELEWRLYVESDSENKEDTNE